jgi:hypothetical protein
MSIPFRAWSFFVFNSPPNADLHSQKMSKEIHMHLIYELMGYRFNQWCNQYSNNDNLMWRDRKNNSFINFKMIPYNDKVGYCSLILVLGSSSIVFQLLFSILFFAQGWIKVGTKGMLNRV